MVRIVAVVYHVIYVVTLYVVTFILNLICISFLVVMKTLLSLMSYVLCHVWYSFLWLVCCGLMHRLGA